MSTITSRWIEAYNELLKRKAIKNAVDFANKTGISNSSITEVLKGRNGAGKRMVSKMLEIFPEVSEVWLTEGKGSMFGTTDMMSLASQIRELKELLDEGIITEKEFMLGKLKILS